MSSYQIKEEGLFYELANENRNSFSLAESRQLKEALDLALNKKLKFFVLTHRGRVFCAGGNLKDYASLNTKEEGVEINTEIGETLQRLSQAPIATLVYLQGDAFGGGVELASAFDFIWASPSSFLGLWQRKVGLSFGWRGAERLLKRLDEKRLSSLGLEARSISSYEALEIGLVDRVVEPQSWQRELRRWIEQQRVLPQAPVAAWKDLSREKAEFETLWWSESHLSILKPKKS